MSSAPQRVLFLIPSMGGGGAERVYLTYLRDLDRQRFEPELVLVNRVGPLLAEIPDGIPVHDLGKRWRFSLPLLVRRFRQLCEERQPSAVVSAIWYADLIALLAHRAEDPWKVLVTIHALARAIESDRFGSAKGALMAQLYPRATAALCVAEAVARDFAGAFQRGARPPVVVQDNPIDLDRVVRAAREGVSEAPPRTRAHRLVVVGRLEAVKGYDLAIEALATMVSQIDVELIIVGTGPEEATLRRLAQEYGVGERVQFTGFVKNPYAIMASADLLLAPSRLEAASLVTIEALALGIPIVVTNAPGASAEIAGFGACGRVVPVESALALASAALELLENADERARLGEAGRRRVQRYHPAIAVRALEDKLERVLAGGTL